MEEGVLGVQGLSTVAQLSGMAYKSVQDWENDVTIGNFYCGDNIIVGREN